MKIDSVEKADWLYDNLLVEQLYNKTQPEWTKKVFPGGEFEKIRNLVFVIDTFNHEMKRLQAGPFLNDVKEDWLKAVKGTTKGRKMKMFSAHDNTLSYILNSLNIYDGVAPSYASAIVFELHQLHDSDYGYVHFLFNTLLCICCDELA